jgi:hypothetical protein
VERWNSEGRTLAAERPTGGSEGSATLVRISPPPGRHPDAAREAWTWREGRWVDPTGLGGAPAVGGGQGRPPGLGRPPRREVGRTPDRGGWRTHRREDPQPHPQPHPQARAGRRRLDPLRLWQRPKSAAVPPRIQASCECEGSPEQGSSWCRQGQDTLPGRRGACGVGGPQSEKSPGGSRSPKEEPPEEQEAARQ